MSNEIKISKKEFFNLFKDKNTVYYVEYLNKNGMIFFEKVRGCNESPERSKDTMTINQLAIIVKEGFNQIHEEFSKVNLRLDKVEQRLDNLEKDVAILKTEMKEVKSDIALIKKCPTIQREMNNF